jgi:hypothetical protein
MDLCNAENAINLGRGEAASIEDGSCCVDFRMPVVDDVPLHRVRRPKISNERNRGEGYAKGAARSIGN